MQAMQVFPIIHEKKQETHQIACCAEKSWRRLRGFVHLADVTQGIDFVNGIKPSEPDQAAA